MSVPGNGGKQSFWQWVVGIAASAALMMAGALWTHVTAKFDHYDTLVETRNVRTSNVEADVAALKVGFASQDQRLQRIERTWGIGGLPAPHVAQATCF